MKKYSCLLLVLLFGCASANQNRAVRVGKVNGSVDFRVVGSYSQVDNPQQAVNANVSVPISGVPTPIDILLNKTGLDAHVSIEIQEVGKDFNLEVIGTGIQNSKSFSIETEKEKIQVGTPVQGE